LGDFEVAAVPKSLYVTEAAMGDFERRQVNDVANLDSVQCWHRNLSRGKGSRIKSSLRWRPRATTATTPTPG
jgi:type III restriction enzyme